SQEESSKKKLSINELNYNSDLYSDDSDYTQSNNIEENNFNYNKNFKLDIANEIKDKEFKRTNKNNYLYSEFSR
ncbi:15117_t:CDS:2, partial [Racocetra fulgida]